MHWPLAASYPDYFLQLGALLRDPTYLGTDVPKGAGEPILLIPGFLCGDWTMGVMAGWLTRLGYRASFSGIAWNIDCPNRTAELLHWRLDSITQATGRPIVVVGHSLGGMLARFLGVNFPKQICHVVAIGSPIDNPMRVHPLVLLASHLLRVLGRTVGNSSSECPNSLPCTCKFAQAVSSPLPQGVRFTAIFSKEDGVVDWRACLDPRGENREVSGRHAGLTVNREVYRILASTLGHAQRVADSACSPVLPERQAA